MSPVFSFVHILLVTPCPLLEKEDFHNEGCGWGYELLQGLSLHGHLAPQRPSAAAQREELWLRLVRVSRLGGREPPVLWVTRLGLAALGLVNELIVHFYVRNGVNRV